MKDGNRKKRIIVFCLFFATVMVFETPVLAFGAKTGDRAFDPLDYPRAAKAQDSDSRELSGEAPTGVTQPTKPESLRIAVNSAGKIDINWSESVSAEGQKVTYVVNRYSAENTVRGVKDTNTVQVYEGAGLSCTDMPDSTWQNGNRYKYNVSAYIKYKPEGSNQTEKVFSEKKYSTGGRGFKGDRNGIVYLSPDEIHMNYTSMTANVGTKRQIRVNYTMDDLVRYANINVPGYWSSSDESIATVNYKGTYTAVAPGKCKIIFRALDGKTASCDLNVGASDTAKGSMYINTGQYYSRQENVIGSKRMLKGRENRLNGKIVSQYKMKKLTIKFLNASGNTERTYVRSLSGNTYYLQKRSKYMPFKYLSYGKKTVQIFVTNTLGTVKLCEEDFRVAKRVSKAEWGQAVAEIVQTRIGDPYSMGSRGYLNYTDCSYLARWCYNNALNKYLPATAAEQYRYCVKHGKKLARNELKPGDLVFFGGPANNGRYKKVNHVEVYLGSEQNTGAIYDGVTRRNTVRPSETESKMYYGRPY